MTDPSKPANNVIRFPGAGARPAADGKPRHIRRQEARTGKAEQAKANRARTGRTKLQKAQDKAPVKKLETHLDGAKRGDKPDGQT